MHQFTLALLWLFAFAACGPSRVEPERSSGSKAGVGPGSFASSTAKEALRKSSVLGTTRKTTTKLVTIRTSEGTVVTTPEHPFARFEGEWTPASQLTIADRLVSHASSTGARILDIQTRNVSATAVYNLTIDKTHAYFVGPERLLVHNVDCA